VSPVIFTPA